MVGKFRKVTLPTSEVDAGVAKFSDHRTVRPQEHRHVVNDVASLLVQAGDDVEIVLVRQRPEEFSGWTGNRLGHLIGTQTGSVVGQGLRQNNEVSLLPRCFLNQRREQAAIALRRLRLRLQMDGRQTNPALRQ